MVEVSVVGQQFDGGAEVLDRPVEVAVSVVRDAAVVKCVRVCGVNLQRPRVVTNRRRKVLQLQQTSWKTQRRMHQAGRTFRTMQYRKDVYGQVQQNRRANNPEHDANTRRYSAVDTILSTKYAHLVVSEASIEVRLEVLGVQLDGACVRLDRRLVVTPLPTREALGVMTVRSQGYIRRH